MKLNKILILIACLSFAAFAYAQEDTNNMGNQYMGKYRSESTNRLTSQERIDNRVNKLTTYLSLTDSQKEQVKDILTTYHQNMYDLRQNKDKNRDAVIALKDTRDNSLKAVFTDDQWTKYQDMRNMMRKGNKRQNTRWN